MLVPAILPGSGILSENETQTKMFSCIWSSKVCYLLLLPTLMHNIIKGNLGNFTDKCFHAAVGDKSFVLLRVDCRQLPTQLYE